jgi:hypothetical protein
MAKIKFSPIITPNTLESMIEYTLLSRIDDKKTIGISKR